MDMKTSNPEGGCPMKDTVARSLIGQPEPNHEFRGAYDYWTYSWTRASLQVNCAGSRRECPCVGRGPHRPP